MSLVSVALAPAAAGQRTGAPVGGYAAAVMAAGPIAYWPLDDAAGSPIAIDVISRRDGIIEGSVGAGLPGAVDNRTAMSFAGDSCNGINLQAHAAALQPQTVSVEAWVYLAADFDRRRVWRSRWDGFQLDFFDGELAVGAYDGERNPGGVSSGYPFTIPRWHHVVGTKGPSSLKLYVDGRLLASKPAAMGIYYAGDQVTIGRDGDACGFGEFAGLIDEVALYDRALSSTEIRNHYNAAFSIPTAVGGGQQIFSQGYGGTGEIEKCTDGFGMTTLAGERFMLTAKHCFPNAPPYGVYDGRFDRLPGYTSIISGNLGVSSRTESVVVGCSFGGSSCRSLPGLDAVLWRPGPESAVTNRVYTQQASARNSLSIDGQVRRGEFGDNKGDLVCAYGATLGRRCGVIQEHLTDENGFDFVRARFCSAQGDSGGPVVIFSGGRWLAVGIVSGAEPSDGTCPNNALTDYIPMYEVAGYLGATAATS